LFAAGGNLAGNVGANIQSLISEKITNDILKKLGSKDRVGLGGFFGELSPPGPMWNNGYFETTPGGITTHIPPGVNNGGYIPPGAGGSGLILPPGVAEERAAQAAKGLGFRGLMSAGKTFAKSSLGIGIGFSIAGSAMGMGADSIKNREAGKHSHTTDVLGLTAARAGQYALTGAGVGLMFGGPIGAGVGAVLGTAYGAFKGFTEANSATNGNFGGDSGAPNAGPKVVAPTSGSITARYGQKPKGNYWKWKGYHTGTDWGVGKGTAVKSIQDGVVTEVGADPNNEAYGTKILIDHGGFQSMYAHLSSYGVRVGQKVKAGDQIGLSGQSGSGASMGPHLHFEIRKGKNNPVDPGNYLSGGILGNSGLIKGIESGASNLIHGAEQAVGNAISSIEKFFSRGEDSTTNAPGSSSGSAGGGSQFSVSNTGFTMSGSGGTSSLAHGGDMGPPSTSTPYSGGIGSGGRGTTINMNVTVTHGNTQDAVRLARDIKNILEKDLRVNTIASN
jgi:hypothetical protein